MRKFRTLITAHSGAEGTPDNTMESIRALVDCGADVLEVDVRLLDGRLVMAHDAPSDGERCDLLSDCLAEVARHDGLMVNLDLKHTGQVARIAALAEQCGMGGRIVLTGGVDDSELSCARAAGLDAWCNDDSLPPDGRPLLDGVSARGQTILNIDYRDVDDALLAHPERLSVWTVDDEAALRRFLAAGVRNITTHRPRLALRLRREMEESF